jgi:hypothetical protein
MIEDMTCFWEGSRQRGLGSNMFNRFGGQGYRFGGDCDQGLGFQQENAGTRGMILFMHITI